MNGKLKKPKPKGKDKSKSKPRKLRDTKRNTQNTDHKDKQDEKLCLTKGQMCNILNAAEKKKNACPAAKNFIRELKSEMREKTIKEKKS